MLILKLVIPDSGRPGVVSSYNEDRKVESAYSENACCESVCCESDAGLLQGAAALVSGGQLHFGQRHQDFGPLFQV